MSQEHHIIFVPGLGGATFLFRRAAASWKKRGVTPHVFDPGWKDGEVLFKPKLKRLAGVVDTLHATGNRVSLIGTSAGGSAVINAFGERKDKIVKVVNVCGRLRAGKDVFPSLNMAAKTSPAFRDSVLMAEKRETGFSSRDRAKILTLRAAYDEIVPASTSPIEGARNIIVPSVEHMLSIALAMTVFSAPIISFFNEND